MGVSWLSFHFHDSCFARVACLRDPCSSVAARAVETAERADGCWALRCCYCCYEGPHELHRRGNRVIPRSAIRTATITLLGIFFSTRTSDD